MMDIETKHTTGDMIEVSPEKAQHDDDVPLDFIDPHRAALEMNPEHSQKLTLSTILAVVVSQSITGCGIAKLDMVPNFTPASHWHYRISVQSLAASPCLRVSW